MKFSEKIRKKPRRISKKRRRSTMTTNSPIPMTTVPIKKPRKTPRPNKFY